MVLGTTKSKAEGNSLLIRCVLRPSRPGSEHRFRARGRGAIARCHCAPRRRCVQERFLFSRCFCILCCSGYLKKIINALPQKGHKSTRKHPRGPKSHQKASKGPPRRRGPPGFARARNEKCYFLIQKSMVLGTKSKAEGNSLLIRCVFTPE